MNQVSLLAAADPMAHVEDGVLDFFPGGWEIGFGKHTFMFILAGLLTLLFFWGYARNAGKQRVPSRYGIFVESVVCFIRDQAVRPFLGVHGDRYLPVLVSFFVYILMCNLLGLIPLFDFISHGGNTATASIAVTAALAMCALVYYHTMGIMEQGLGPYIKNLFPHVPILLLPLIIVVELAAHLVRPCALAIRLFANMFAGHTMMAIVLGFTAVWTKDFFVTGAVVSVVSFLAATALTFLELLVALIQAFVFTFLTTVFLAGAVHPDH